MIDTHAHLTYDELESQIDAVLARSLDAGVTHWLTIGTDRAQCRRALQLAGRFVNMYAGLGFHPHYANDITEDDFSFLRAACDDPLVKAVGETGLDYHYDNLVIENQTRVFRAHLEIAVQVHKPVIIHTRSAFDDTMKILDEYAGRLKRVVIHCYGGDEAQTRFVLDRGYYISFTGTVTFKRSDALRQVAKMIPLDRLMIESDCPFISPEPVRRIQPNEPALIVHTARCLAGLFGLTLEDFADKITRTSKTFYEIE
jgi:TatD DNase family protein